MMPNTFTIVFTQGLDYVAKNTAQMQQFQNTIYDSFCLLSWLIPDYHIRVMDQIVLNQIYTLKIFRKGQDGCEYCLLERRKGNRIFYSISSCFSDNKQKMINEAVSISRKEEGISAQFVSDSRLDYFRIIICCKAYVYVGLSFNSIFNDKRSKQDGYNYFKPPCRKPNNLRGSQLDLEYYYIQPQSRRFHEPQGYHLNLAFQGGGSKGISYIGAKKAINNMQKRIKAQSDNKISLPIKSLLGSSAGGILGLPISVNVEHQDFIDICLMMDSLAEDRLIQADDLSQTNLNKINQKYSQNMSSQYFSQQQTAIKNTLHNLGLVQQSLSDIIFQTLKQPSIQERIHALFMELNPTVAQFLGFQQPYQKASGQSINNCMGSCFCCCYKDCCGCYPCCKAIPCSTCFITQSKQYRKINVYGLLHAAIMTGDTIENMMAYSLSLFMEIQANNNSEKICDFFRRKKWSNSTDNYVITNEIKEKMSKMRKTYRQKQNKYDRSYLQNILIEYSKEITLEQYYQLSGIEFTCTSVDLNDKIQRFFNHKTTPNLPVCKTVQLTGSFPVAFLSLQWKKQWGKYYIHYDRTRREIDLTGHHFSDGGWLANFPLKFLDNQKFRQKYFSHKSVKGKTILYGFGTQQLQDFPQNDKSQRIDQCMNSLLQEFKYRAMYRVMLYLMKCGSKKTLQVKKVRLFQFFISLVEALRESDRNLNKECFKYEIIQTVMTKKPMRNKDIKDIKISFANLTEMLGSNIQSHFNKKKLQFLNDEFDAIYSGFSKFAEGVKGGNKLAYQISSEWLSWAQVQQIERRIQNNILVYSQKCIQIYQRKRQQLNKKYQNTDLFMTSASLHHQYEILSILYELKQCLINLPQGQFSSIKEMMDRNCSQYFKIFTSMYQQVLENLHQQDEHQRKQTIIRQKQVINLLNIKYQLSPYILALFNRIDSMSEFQHSTPLINFYVEENTFLMKDKIKASIANQIMQKKDEFQLQNRKAVKHIATRLHIIFEASYFSHYYFMNYIKIVEEVIADKDIKIDIISCTSYHAIFGVFYLLGYNPNTVKRAMYEIQYLFEENEHIEQVYASKEWTKTSIEQMRTLLKREWERHVDPFEIIQYQFSLTKQRLSQRLQIHSDVYSHIQMDHQYINAAFEKVIDYISTSLEEIFKLSQQERKDRFDQLLSLGKHKKANKNKSKAGERVISIFLKYTINLIMITAEHIFKSQQFVLFSSKKWSKETVFKGMVISSLINAYKYRIYIYDLLSRAGLDRNITLAKFYDVCQRKIVLNFNCTNTSQQRFQLINKITKPNMPLWAALMACASLPYLEGEFESFKQWDNREKGDIKVEMAEAFFRKFDHQIGNRQNSYISGNAISTLPIQTITNERLIKSKLTQDQATNTIEIVFAFDSQFNKKIGNSLDEETEDKQKFLNKEAQLTTFFSQLPLRMQGKRRFINCFDVIRYLLQALCHSECAFGNYFGDVLGRIGTLKMLQTKFSAHDNLIVNLYHDSLISLPIRIGTLEFYRVTRTRPDLTDAVTQAQQVVREVCDSVKVDPFDKGKIEFITPSRTTIQLSRHKCDVYDKQRALWSPQQRFYRVKFISFTKWRNLKNKYLVQYSLNVEANALRHVEWVRLREDYADFPESVFEGNQYKLLLKFTYYQDRLVSRIYLLSMEALRELQLDPIRAIFSLDYRQVYSTAEPLKLYHQSDPIADITVKSYFIPHDSRYCCNLQCSADKLEYVLMREEHRTCFTCSAEHLLSGKSLEDVSLLFGEMQSEPSLIAMRCLRCSKSYCLKCKISSFIVKRVTNAKEDTYHYECPKNEGRANCQKQVYELGKAPIAESCLGEGRETSKNGCLFCGRYSSKLYYERDIIKGRRPRNQFGGLRICEMCILYHVK